MLHCLGGSLAESFQVVEVLKDGTNEWPDLFIDLPKHLLSLAMVQVFAFFGQVTNELEVVTAVVIDVTIDIVLL